MLIMVLFYSIGIGFGDTVVKMLLLVLFGQILFDLCFEWGKIVLDCIPHFRLADLIIAMNKHVSHTNNILPFHFMMAITEFFCKHVGRFSNDFNIFDNGKIHHHIG